MRFNLAAACQVYALPLLAWLAACGNLPADQQASLQQAVAVACIVDGVLVPVAQPLVASLGQPGATTAGSDYLLLHPAVIAACQALDGTPASAVPVTAR